MEKKNIKALLSATAVAAALVACFGLAGCGSSAASSSAAAASSEAAASAEAAASSEAASEEAASSEAADVAAPGEDAGFEETPIFEDEVAGGWLNVSAVYFQPVPMTDGSTIEGKDIHLEADIHALDNEFGFPKGDWVPYMTVSYKITGDNLDKPIEGVFMEMNASDGQHYGANIEMPEAGTYTIEITMTSPADNNYLIHTDAETGPGAKSFDELPDGSSWPLTVTGTWDYVPLEY